ncbi:MAG: hypothetical protein RMK94_16295 [Armatimonadota bacterium]|nr:hypothetical protein [Armatimonadota bacterium]
MKNWDLVKIIVLILLPINAWLFVFLYLNYQKTKYLELSHDELLRRDETGVIEFLHEKYGIRVGQTLKLPLRRPSMGLSPPLRMGYPVCFINISGPALPEIWEPVVSEALKVSPYLYVVLLYPNDSLASVKEIFQKFNNPRLSAFPADFVQRALGHYREGILLTLCDGRGVVQAIEPYPSLKVSPSLEEEIKDWRPKLHQAVKKVLDKFFPRRGASTK